MKPHFIWIILLAGSTTYTPASAAQAADSKGLAPVPSLAERTKAERTVRDIFRDDFSRQDPEVRRALAAKLLAQANQTEDLTTRYALLQESIDVSAMAGDAKGVISAVDDMASTFAVDALELKATAMNTTFRSVRNEIDAAALASACVSETDRAIAADRLDLAAKFAAEGEAAARLSKEVSLFTAAHAKVEDVRTAVRETQKFKLAQDTLRARPDDAAANLTVGRYLCSRKGEWEKGLRCLSRSSQPSLAATAKEDLANPSEPSSQLLVANRWADLSKDEKLELSTAAAQRAVFWYRKAIPSLTGLEKVAAERRLWAIVRAASGGHVAIFKFVTDQNEPLLLPMSDPCPDVLTVTPQGAGFHMVGTKTSDTALIRGKTRGHIGKAILYPLTEAGGTLHVEISALGGTITYHLLMTDKHDVLHMQRLMLTADDHYTWRVFEQDGAVIATVNSEDKQLASIKLPSDEFSAFGFGSTLRNPTEKADLTVQFD